MYNFTQFIDVSLFEFLSLFSVNWEWVEIGSHWYMFDDILYKHRTFDESVNFCQSLGDDVILFEPRSAETLTAVMNKLNLEQDYYRVWINAQRSTDDK